MSIGKTGWEHYNKSPRDWNWDEVYIGAEEGYNRFALMRWRDNVLGREPNGCRFCRSAPELTMIFRDPNWEIHIRHLCDECGLHEHGFLRWEFMKAKLRTITPTKIGDRCFEYDSPYPRRPTWSSS